MVLYFWLWVYNISHFASTFVEGNSHPCESTGTACKGPLHVERIRVAFLKIDPTKMLQRGAALLWSYIAPRVAELSSVQRALFQEPLQDFVLYSHICVYFVSWVCQSLMVSYLLRQSDLPSAQGDNPESSGGRIS